MYILVLLIAGPFSALPAVILALRRRHWGATWLIVGGLISVALGVPLFFTRLGDWAIFPVLASLPMVMAGIWLNRASTLANREQLQPAEHASGSAGPPASRGGIGSILLSILLFLVGWIGIYVVFVVLAMNNITGLRGPPLPGNPFAHENENLADGITLLVLAGFVGFMSIVRQGLRLRAEFVAGMWFALLLAGLIIVLR